MLKLDQICLSPYFQSTRLSWNLSTHVEYIFTDFVLGILNASLLIGGEWSCDQDAGLWLVRMLNGSLYIICSCHCAINKHTHKYKYKYKNTKYGQFANQKEIKLSYVREKWDGKSNQETNKKLKYRDLHRILAINLLKKQQEFILQRSSSLYCSEMAQF